MKHFISTNLIGASFDEAEKQITENLKAQGFGILTEIDVAGTLKKKLDIDFKKYKILGACNPQIAYKVLQIDDKAGVFLPCNIVLEENENGTIEVSAVSPVASMMSIENKEIDKLMQEVEKKLIAAIDSLK
jgi:uncharacterized protein (DUF302 family)